MVGGLPCPINKDSGTTGCCQVTKHLKSGFASLVFDSDGNVLMTELDSLGTFIMTASINIDVRFDSRNCMCC